MYSPHVDRDIVFRGGNQAWVVYLWNMIDDCQYDNCNCYPYEHHNRHEYMKKEGIINEVLT